MVLWWRRWSSPLLPLILVPSLALVPPSRCCRRPETALRALESLDYASTVAASALVTCAATLPVVGMLGKRGFERRLELDNVLQEDVETPYPGGANSYSPEKADEFYRKRPLLVASRLIGLLQATLSFQVKLLIDWKTGNLERNEAERARQALGLVEELGPTFIKLGQALSIRTDLIPEAYALELRKLQDAVPPFSDAQAREVMKKAFGVGDLSEIFEDDLTEQSIASASIGQVYRGTLKPGDYECGGAPVRQVAVKVQRPGVLAEICIDLYLLRLLAPLQTRIANAVNKVPTDPEDVEIALALVDEWGRGFVNEVDYYAEAKNTMEFSEAMRRRGLGAVVSPRVVKELSTGNVLVTEWIEGTRLDVTGSPDVPRLCGVAINAYLTMLLDTGCIHCDPHPGNLLRTVDGKLCILDWGMTLEVPKDLQYSLLEFIAHINTNQLDRIPYDFVNLGFTPPDKVERVANSGVTDGFAFMLRQLSQGGGPAKMRERVKSEFVARYGDVDDDELRKRARAEMISRMEKQLEAEGVDVRGVSNVMQEMSRRNRELFRLPEWVLYVVRAFSVLEGIGLSIDENYSILAECYPYTSRRLLTDNSPRARAALEAMVRPADAGGGGLDLDKLIEMADQFTSYSVSTSGVDKYASFDGTSTAIAVNSEKNKNTDLVVESSAAPPAVSPGVVQAQRELAAVLFSKNASFAQKLVIDETARLADASVRSTLYNALDATGLVAASKDDRREDANEDNNVADAPRRLLRQGSASLRSLPGPVRVAALPITAPLEIASTAVNVLAPLVAQDEADRKALKSIETLSSLVGNATSANGFEDVAKLASDQQIDIAAVVSDPDNIDAAATIARRFGATLLRRAAAKLEGGGEKGDATPDHEHGTSSSSSSSSSSLESRLSASAASTLAEVYRDAASVIGPSSDEH